MPNEFANDEEELQFKNEKPLVAFACGEKTKIALNYATFALMLPALHEHHKFKGLMWMLRVEEQDREERANRQANTVADFHLNINI